MSSRNFLRGAFGSLAACVLLAGQISAQDRQVDVVVPADAATVAPEAASLVHVRQMIGLTVRDTSGKPLGTIEDLVVDNRTSQIKYVVLDGSEFTPLGERRLVMPYAVVTPHWGDDPAKYHAVTQVPRERLLKAPAYNVREIRGGNVWVHDVDKYYHISLPSGELLRRVD